MRFPYSVIALLSAILSVAGCAKPAPATLPEQSYNTADERLVEAAVSNDPWYAARLKDLGFYVFPTPEPLPLFSVRTLSGKEASLADLAGKVVLLNFWATWCPPCKMEMPSIQTLHERLKGKSFEIMAVSVAEKSSTVQDFLKKNPYTYPIYLDESGSASSAFVGRGIPTTFILDKQGRAIAGIIGSRSYDGAELVALFVELAEKLP